MIRFFKHLKSTDFETVYNCTKKDYKGKKDEKTSALSFVKKH